MKKLFSKLGYIPKAALEELNAKLIGTSAVNASLKEQIINIERELRQVIAEREKHKLAHEALKEEHEKQLRVRDKLAQGLASVPITTITGIRK